VNPLSYGIAAFGADLGARTQPVALTAPKLVKPGQTLRIRVAPASHRGWRCWRLTREFCRSARYRSPDPLGYFFQKKMLEVQTSQVLDLILPDFARFLALAAPGGDADAGFSRHLNPFAKKRKARSPTGRASSARVAKAASSPIPCRITSTAAAHCGRQCECEARGCGRNCHGRYAGISSSRRTCLRP
jgi:hypothetical protein